MKDPYKAIVGLLKSHNIAFESVEHEPVYTSEQAAEVRGMDISTGAKSLLFKTKQGFVLVVLPGSERVDSKKLKRLLGVSEVRFAKPEEVKECMGCEIGACYPLGVVAGLRTLVDRKLAKNDMISFNPGRHDVSVKMTYHDYEKLAQPQLVEVTA